MTGTTWTDRRRRFDHLIGIDRYRIVCTYCDHSIRTESFEEITINGAQATAAALLTPARCLGDRPVMIEIRLGHWAAAGSNDCEWTDIQAVAIGHVDTNTEVLIWSSPHAESGPALQETLPFGATQTAGVGGRR